MAEIPPASRPPLASNDYMYFEALQLIGKLGVAALAADNTADSNGKPLTARRGPDAMDFGASQTATPALELSEEESIEDYDKLEMDPDTLITQSRGSLGDVFGPTNGIMSAEEEIDPLQRPATEQGKSGKLKKRNSIPIRLEKTNRKGRYILTADDPDIREILRKGLEREETSNGKKSRALFRDLVFTRQFTTFDRQNPASHDSRFFGFFTLFWLAMIFIFVRVAAQNWRDYGSILGQNELMKIMFSRELLMLGITDGTMCALTAVGLMLQQAVFKDYINWARSGWILQNIWQSAYLATIIWWTWFRDWPWTHTVFVVLHGLVFVMKQHSYAFYNGYLSGVYRRRALLQAKLARLEEMEPVTSPPTSPSAFMQSDNPASGVDYSELGQQGSSFKNRRRSTGPRTSINFVVEKSDVAHVASAIDSGKPLDQDEMRAFERVMKAEISDLSTELRGKSSIASTSYPHNLTLFNFAEWTCFPTLVYELEYPRQDHINWWYVAEKTAATFGCIALMMVISQAFIYPPVAAMIEMKQAGVSMQERWNEFPWLVSDIIFPLLLEQLLTWYVIWECVLNVLAELTYFADRGFYGDWWNSGSFDQYARDWNRPVHNFLLRHVYHSSISTFHLSRSSATFVTFLLSALVHELVMACLFKKVRGYLFTMQLLQMPLVSLSRTKLLKGRTVMGNAVFWLGLFLGPSLLTSLYLVI